jgi:DNA-binding response OmpR family regulator
MRLCVGSHLVGRGRVSILLVDDELPSATAFVLETFGVTFTRVPSSTLAAGLRCEMVIVDTACGEAQLPAAFKRLRAAGYVGWIIAVANRHEYGIELLDTGADDFVLAPPDGAELTARIRVGLRRMGATWRARWRELEVDRVRHLAYLRGHPLTLTPREYAVLASLVEAQGGVLSRAELFAKAWGNTGAFRSNLVEAHVSRLRAKLGRDAGLVETVRPSGYRLSR